MCSRSDTDMVVACLFVFDRLEMAFFLFVLRLIGESLYYLVCVIRFMPGAGVCFLLG